MLFRQLRAAKNIRLLQQAAQVHSKQQQGAAENSSKQ